MLHRRTRALAAPVLGVALAASLSACGFHYPTDRVNTIAAGENFRDASHTVYALGMRILSPQEGQARLIGTLSNEEDTPAKLTAVSLPEGMKADFAPVSIPAGGSINLSTDTQHTVPITGDVVPGTVATDVRLTFSREGKTESITMNLPVVNGCTEYTAVPTPSEASSPAKGAAGSASASTSESASPSAEPSESGSPSEGPWACTWETPGESSGE